MCVCWQSFVALWINSSWDSFSLRASKIRFVEKRWLRNWFYLIMQNSVFLWFYACVKTTRKMVGYPKNGPPGMHSASGFFSCVCCVWVCVCFELNGVCQVSVIHRCYYWWILFKNYSYFAWLFFSFVFYDMYLWNLDKTWICLSGFEFDTARIMKYFFTTSKKMCFHLYSSIFLSLK